MAFRRIAAWVKLYERATHIVRSNPLPWPLNWCSSRQCTLHPRSPATWHACSLDIHRRLKISSECFQRNHGHVFNQTQHPGNDMLWWQIQHTTLDSKITANNLSAATNARTTCNLILYHFCSGLHDVFYSTEQMTLSHITTSTNLKSCIKLLRAPQLS